MATVLWFLAENGAMLFAGVSALLGLGCVAAAVCRSPVHRQRVCEAALVVAAGWALLASIPLPRLVWREIHVSERTIPASARDVAMLDIPAELVARPRIPGASRERVRDVIGPTRSGGVDVRGWWVVVYLTGSVVCAVWLGIGLGVLGRVIRRAEAAPPAVTEWARSCAGAGARTVRVLVSARVAGPVTFGVWRPVILLPAGLLADGREGELRQVVRHEVSHVLRGDGWGNLLFCLALPALYFHPCYWWLRHCAETARELVADDWAARADGKEAYATALVALARSRVTGGAPAGVLVGGIGMFQRRSAFYRRMRMLLQRSEPLATGCSRTWRGMVGLAGLAVVAGAAAVVGVRPARAQDAGPTAPAAAQFRDEPHPAERPPEAGQSNDATAPEGREELEARLAKAEGDAKAYRERLRKLGPKPAPGATTPSRAPTTFRGNPAYSDPYAFRGREAGGGAGNPDGGGSPAGMATGGGVGGVQLDLVNLANSLVDASGAYTQAQIAFDAKEKVNRAGGAMSSLEFAEARARLETARKRVDLLRSIARVAMESARLNYARLKQLNSMGMVDNQAFDEAASKVKMLEVIVKGAE